ncbi:unnamed protein product [Callosobruchus maculatus]|uniref:C2H2-type domain-containing protein n=1 Tax=Callosobruchus maculatus TaxID=64391 RepID=A0A653C397_CALMS|nr:unnamed protein product [Callosobruchus maculatus]
MDCCALCKNKLQTKKYDLKTATTFHSTTSLIDLIERIIGSRYSLLPTVCEQCFLILNEYEELNTRLINLSSLVKYYVENKNICLDRVVISLCETENIYSIEEKYPTPSVINSPKAGILSNLNHISNMENLIENQNHTDDIQKYDLMTSSVNSDDKINEKSFICEVCGQTFEKKRLLTNHMKIHSFARSLFLCNYCDKSFTQKVSLLRHLPIHTGEKPYQCEVCGKRFIHHTSFKVHKLSHTGVKAYKCTYCEQSLSSSSHLKRHLRIHTGEKRYACDVCGKQFAEHYNLVAHKKLHTVGAKPRLNTKNKLKFRCTIG